MSYHKQHVIELDGFDIGKSLVIVKKYKYDGAMREKTIKIREIYAISHYYKSVSITDHKLATNTFPLDSEIVGELLD